MEREERYLVLKHADIEKYLAKAEYEALCALVQKISEGRWSEGKHGQKTFVCVANTWPEYEAVWQMIEARVDREQGSPATTPEGRKT